MRFQVPQFIEIEDKIIGPLTFKQFLYLGGGGGLSVTLYLLLPKFIAFLLILPIVAFAGALAFYKINNKPFINILEAFFTYSIGRKLYIWKKIPKKETAAQAAEAQSYTQIYVPHLGESKLKDLTWNLDVKQNLKEVVETEKVGSKNNVV